MARPSAAMADAETGPAAPESTEIATASVENMASSTEKSLDANTDPNMVNWEGPDDPENPRNGGKVSRCSMSCYLGSRFPARTKPVVVRFLLSLTSLQQLRDHHVCACGPAACR
jgi:hypothetical protein